MNRDPYDDSLLCLSLNLNGLKHKQWKDKNKQLRKYLKNYEFDIMGFQEVNLNWGKVGPKDQWEERTMGWWKGGNTTVRAYNKEDVISTASQPGGCMVTSVNTAKRKVIGCGVDPRNLGRWAWTRYQGKHQFSLQVISAYRSGDNAGAVIVELLLRNR